MYLYITLYISKESKMRTTETARLPLFFRSKLITTVQGEQVVFLASKSSLSLKNTKKVCTNRLIL